MPIGDGQALMRALRGQLSGLAQPTYVLDMPGGHGKVPIGPAYLGDDPDALVIGTPSADATAIALSLFDQASVADRPLASTTSSTSLLPAFSNTSVTARRAPATSGAPRSIRSR